MESYESFARLMQERGVTPYKVSRETGIAQSTLSDWKRGVSTPKADKMKTLAEYFGVSVDVLLGRKKVQDPSVIVMDERDTVIRLDEDTLELIEELRTRPEMKMMFSATRKATREDILKAIRIIEVLRDEGGGL